MKKNAKFKLKLMFLVLLYIAFFSFTFIAVSYSKLSSIVILEGDVGIAKWDVSIGNTSGTNIIVPRGISSQNNASLQTFVLTVTSHSDVGLDYEVVIKNVPSDVSVQFDNGLTTYTPTAAGVITISGLSSLHFNASDNNATHTHNILFLADANATLVSNRSLNLEVIFTQEVIH